jgi:hypothetical protein
MTGGAVTKNIGARSILLAVAALMLSSCASPGGPGTAPAPASANQQTAEGITVTPISEAERRAIFDDKDLNSLQGAAGLVYSPQQALIAFDDDPRCGFTLEGISLVRETITLELTTKAPQAAGAGGDASLASFRTNVPRSTPPCQQNNHLDLSFYKLALKDPLFIPGQSHPITIRVQGKNHTDQLIWKDPKK